jgi:hypothetical protein
VDERG